MKVFYWVRIESGHWLQVSRRRWERATGPRIIVHALGTAANHERIKRLMSLPN
ncbi:MAG: hypothetical protein AAB468_00295 [Patescibacteria group bacterium]